jgi:flagellar biosynthesis chaperone FliJ
MKFLAIDMADDPIRLLQALRRRSVEEARQALGTCLAAEAQLAETIREIDAQSEIDLAANQDVNEAHRFLEMFARRLRVREAERKAAAAALTAAQTRSDEARLFVVAARTAAEALDALIAEKAAAMQANTDRREQHALDDIARNRSDPGFRPIAGRR